MSTNVQKFQLTQGGINYILTSQIEGDFIKLTCVKSDDPNSPIYIGRFSLVQLKQISKLFDTITTIYQAQDFLNQSLEKQKVNVKLDGILMSITLYFQREVQAENIIETTTDYNSQAQEINYESQPIEYNTVEETQNYYNIPITTNTTTETVENTVNYIPETTNYEVAQDNVYTTTTEIPTYENYDYGVTTNYQNYQTYDNNINIDTNLNTNTNYDYNLNNAVEVQQTQTNTYETTTVHTPTMETLTLSLTLKPQVQEQPKIPVVDNTKYLNEIEQLKNQIRILREENTILKTKTIEKTIVTKTDQSGEILLLKQEIERLKQEIARLISIKTNFEIYKKQKETEITNLKLRIEELLKQISLLEQRIYKESLIKQQKTANEKQSLTIQDTRLEIVKGDIIQNATELELLTRKICKNYHKITLNLLYKATVDSDKAAVFHEKCDAASNSLVLVQSGNGKRFGGYTSCSWEGNQIEKKDENAFVFSLDKMETYNIIPDEDAIGCYPKYGPVFLGCQIRIFDEFFKNGGSTYEKGMNYNTNEDFELTGGLKTFDVKEIEVYGIELK